MRTKQVVDLGIKRCFIRKCEDKKIIKPKREKGYDINPGYARDMHKRIYTQEDIEKLWSAYVYRELGFSFDQILNIQKGEEIIPLTNSASDLIEKYEKEIEEKRTMIKFLKYVKGLGYIPRHPKVLLESSSFPQYLVDLMRTIDKENILYNYLDIAEEINRGRFNNLQKFDIEKINEKTEKISNSIKEIVLIDSNPVSDLMKLADKFPDSEEVRELIYKMYENAKSLSDTAVDLSISEYAENLVCFLTTDSEFSKSIKCLYSKKEIEFLIQALFYLISHLNPNRIKILLQDS